MGDVLLRYYTYTDSYHMTCIKLGVVCFSTASLSVSVYHNLGLCNGMTCRCIRSQNVKFCGPNFTSLWTIIVMGSGRDISAILYSRTPD